MALKVIKSMTDANKLIELGFNVEKIDRDKYNRDYLIFLFNDTSDLRCCLDKLNIK